MYCNQWLRMYFAINILLLVCLIRVTCVMMSPFVLDFDRPTVAFCRRANFGSGQFRCAERCCGDEDLGRQWSDHHLHHPSAPIGDLQPVPKVSLDSKMRI